MASHASNSKSALSPARQRISSTSQRGRPTPGTGSGVEGSAEMRQRVVAAVGWPKSDASVCRLHRRSTMPIVPEPQRHLYFEIFLKLNSGILRSAKRKSSLPPRRKRQPRTSPCSFVSLSGALRARVESCEILEVETIAHGALESSDAAAKLRLRERARPRLHRQR